MIDEWKESLAFDIEDVCFAYFIKNEICLLILLLVLTSLLG